MKKVFTTGQVAKICKVAPRTVSKWFDTGKLRGYRIPGSQDRRIPREHLIRFLKEHGMPLGELEGKYFLLVTEDADLEDEFISSFPNNCVDVVTSVLSVGIRPPFVHSHIFLDLNIGRSTVVATAKYLRYEVMYADPIIAMAGQEETDVNELLKAGCNDVLPYREDVYSRVDRVRQMT